MFTAMRLGPLKKAIDIQNIQRPFVHDDDRMIKEIHPRCGPNQISQWKVEAWKVLAWKSLAHQLGDLFVANGRFMRSLVGVGNDCVGDELCNEMLMVQKSGKHQLIW